MKMILLTSINNAKVYIPLDKITGFVEASNVKDCKSYIATGAEGEDTENGWYVKESIREIYMHIEALD
jgi:hypothetical protein